MYIVWSDHVPGTSVINIRYVNAINKNPMRNLITYYYHQKSKIKLLITDRIECVILIVAFYEL